MAAVDAAASGDRPGVDAALRGNANGGARMIDASAAGGGAGGAGGGAGARADAALAGARDGGGIIRTDAGWPPVCPTPSTPPPASVDSIGACGATLTIGDTLRVAPAPAGQAYLRCGTVGSETTWQVILSPDASHLAAVTSAGTVRLFATDDWHEIAQLTSPIGQLDAAAFSPDGTTLATVSRELGAVMLWRAGDGQLIRSIAVPARTTIANANSALAFSSDGRQLATSLYVNVDLATDAVTDWAGNPIVAPTRPADLSVAGSTTGLNFPYQLRFVGCDSRVLLYASDPAGNAGTAQNVSLIDPMGKAGVALAGGLYAHIDGVAASNDGRWVALDLAEDNGPARLGLSLYDAASGALYATDSSATGQVVGFSPSGTELYAATTSQIIVRAVPTLAILRRLPLPSGAALVGVSPLGPLIVSTAAASQWLEPIEGNLVRQAAFPISAPSFSADGRYGVASGGSALFHLWREADATPLCAPLAPPAGAAVVTMALSPDGRTLGLERTDSAVELRPVADSGDIGAPRTTVVTGFTPPYFPAIRVANGGRLAVQGTPDPVGPYGATSPSNVGVFDDTSQLLFAAAIYPYGLFHLALSPDGKEVAYVTGSPTVPLGETGQQLAVASVDSNAVIFTIPFGAPFDSSIDSFSADGTRIALPAEDGIEIWRLADGQKEEAIGDLAGDQTWAASFSPSWTYLAAPTFPPDSSPLYTQPYLEIWNRAGADVARITPLDLDSPAWVDDTGSIVVADELVTHTLANSWYALVVYDLPSGTERRMFHTTASEGEPVLTLAGGTRIVTRLGSALAVWCR